MRTRYAVFRLGVTVPAPDASGQAGAAETRVATLQVLNGGVVSDALPPDVVPQRKCRVRDGFFGRKGKRR